MNLSFLSRRQYAVNLCATFGLTYKEDPKCQVPHATRNTVVVPVYKVSFTDEEENSWFGSLIHECYHHQYPADFVFLESKKITRKTLTVGMNNLVCDHKIEKNQYGVYAGRDKIMDRNTARLVTEILERSKLPVRQQLEMAMERGSVKEMPSEERIEQITLEQDKQMAALMFDIQARKRWQPCTAGFGCSLYTAKANELLTALLACEGLLDSYANAYTPQEQWDVAERMVEILGDTEYEEQEQEGVIPVEMASTVLFDDIVYEPHAGDGTSHVPLHIEYNEWYEGSYAMRIPNVLSFEDGSAQARFTGCTSYTQEIAEAGCGRGISEAIRKYLIVLKRGHYEGSKGVGKVHKRSVWKTKRYAGMPQAQQIHRRKIATNVTDAAITLLLDQSGSMGGSKYIHAGHSVVLLNQVFAKIGVPVEILSFTDTGGSALNIIHKSFVKGIADTKLVEQLGQASKCMSGNSDGESILWASERLRARPEKKKIMVVLSDGSPAGSGGSNLDGFTRDVVKQLEKVIDIHGIGIEDDNVKRYYSSCEVINNTEQLENALISVLKNKVLR